MSARPYIKEKEPTDQDFELNIAPFIDCFTVLITYLLFSASFLSLGVFDVSLMNGGADSTPGIAPKVNVAVEIDPAENMRIRVSGQETQTISLPARNGTGDFGSLEKALESIKERWPDLNGAVVAAQNSVEYKEIVRTIETTRKVLPSVALGDVQGG